MRILLRHPNSHSGGAEITGNWSPAWVADLTGHLRTAGQADITLVDALTHHLEDEQVRARDAVARIGLNAITRVIEALDPGPAQRVLARAGLLCHLRSPPDAMVAGARPGAMRSAPSKCAGDATPAEPVRAAWRVGPKPCFRLRRLTIQATAGAQRHPVPSSAHCRAFRPPPPP